MFSFINNFDTIKGRRITLKIAGRYAGDSARLPFYLYDIHAGNAVVGRISVHIGHNKASYTGGNIGYEIYPEYRGKRYSLEAARLVLPVAGAHGMDYLIITCYDSNTASKRIAVLLGARLIEKTASDNAPDKILCIYKVDL